MFRLAPNIDLLLTEAGDSHVDRARAAASAGLDIRDLVSAYQG